MDQDSSLDFQLSHLFSKQCNIERDEAQAKSRKLESFKTGYRKQSYAIPELPGYTLKQGDWEVLLM